VDYAEIESRWHAHNKPNKALLFGFKMDAIDVDTLVCTVFIFCFPCA